MRISYKQRLIIAGIVLSFILLLHYLGIGNYITLDRLQQNITYLQNIVEHHYTVAVFSYMIIFILAALLSIPVTVLLTILGGFLFGTFVGLIYAIISATIGATLLFLAVRYLIGNFVQKTFKRQLVAFNENIEMYGYSYLLTLQLLPITPTFLINVLAGLTPLSLWTFVWTTAVGIMPGSLIYTIVGQQLQTIKSVSNIFSLPMLIASTLLAILALLPVLLRWLHTTPSD